MLLLRRGGPTVNLSRHVEGDAASLFPQILGPKVCGLSPTATPKRLGATPFLHIGETDCVAGHIGLEL